MLRCRVIFQRLLLESLERLIAVSFALRTRIDYCMYQPQFVRALRTWRVRVMDQVFCFQQLHLQIVIMVMKKDAISLSQVGYCLRQCLHELSANSSPNSDTTDVYRSDKSI